MANTLRRLYLRFRSPKIFLIALTTFIISSLALHYLRGYDADWGGTNLTLSIEASVASAVVTVGVEETIILLRKILALVEDVHELLLVVKELNERQGHTLRGVLLIAEGMRDELLAQQEDRHGA